MKKLVRTAVEREAFEAGQRRMKVVNESRHEAQARLIPEIINVLGGKHDKLAEVSEHPVWFPLEELAPALHELSGVGGEMFLRLLAKKVQDGRGVDVGDVIVPTWYKFEQEKKREKGSDDT